LATRGRRPKVEPTMDANVTVRMTPGLYERLSAVAKADKRPVGMMARIIIEESLATFEKRLTPQEDEEH